jgi:tetratricopeptide (TPR) repeat protein
LYQKQRDSFAPNDTFGQWKASTNLASVYYYMKDYETSLKYYGKSLQLAKQMKDNQSVLLNYNDIIQIYMAQ